MSTLVTMNVTWALDLVTSGHGLSIKCLPSALTTQTHDQYHVSLLCYAWKLLIWNRGVRSHQRSVFQIRKYGKTRVLSDQVGISLPAYSTHVLQQSKQTQTKAKSENVFVHSFIPSRIFQRRRSKIYFQTS